MGESENKKKHRKGKSIKRSLLLGIIGLVICISAAYGIINGILFYLDAKNTISTRLTESAAAYSQSVENAINVYRSRIENIADDPAVTDSGLSQDERKELLARLAQENGFATLSVSDKDGKTSDGGDASQREYFKQSMAGNTYVSSTIVSNATGKTVLIVSAKIDAEQSEGVVIATLDSDTFSEMIDGVEVGKSGYGFIVDKEGKIIAHKNRDRVDEQTNYIEMAKTDKNYEKTASEIQDMIAGKTGIETVNFKGENMTTGYAPIPDTDGWSIGVVAKESELMSSFYKSIELTIIFTLILVVISVLFAFKIANPIVNPIIAIVERIKSLDEGDLHSEVPEVNTGNELEVLSQSFTGTVKTLNSYIHEITYILTSLEAGNCTIETKQEYKGDFVRIKQALDGIIENLNASMGNIKASSNQVADGAREISSASQSLATGATEQAATVEQLNASITSVSHQAEQNSLHVSKAIGYVKETASGIKEGNICMESLETAMKEIGESSMEISTITKAIESIAFQTNILALNAAVESARAGEAGKGFAVVADEVRNLAAKSAEAAKQTADLIERAVNTVREGEKMTSQSAVILQQIAEKSSLVEQAVQEIASASSQQVQSVEEINQGLAQVSTVVQNNAATAEESSASSEELDALAQTLKQEVEKFQLKQEETEEILFNPEESEPDEFGKY